MDYNVFLIYGVLNSTYKILIIFLTLYIRFFTLTNVIPNLASTSIVLEVRYLANHCNTSLSARGWALTTYRRGYCKASRLSLCARGNLRAVWDERDIFATKWRHEIHLSQLNLLRRRPTLLFKRSHHFALSGND